LLACPRLSTLLDDRTKARARKLATAPIAVSLSGVSKTFRLPHQRYSTLKERALHPFRSRTFDELRAVQDVNLDIRQGEFFGIVGRNGSGKSTLLKCLAGIYSADTGTVTVSGRLAPFIELGVGLNGDLTARDNVMINAVLLGLSRQQAKERFEDIIAFAELEDFLDLKLKNYSSGMTVRLAFSVSVQVDADVLLVDEVLAVGDAAFQQKCFEQFQRLKDQGKTIILVTHDMAAVERFCDRAMLIEKGEVLSIGDPHDISRAYNELNFGRLQHEGVEHGRSGDHAAAEIVEAWFESGGERVGALAQGEHLEIAMRVRFHDTVENPIFGFALRNEMGHTVFATSSALRNLETGTFHAGDQTVVRVGVEHRFAPSLYKLTPSVARAGAGADALDMREDLTQVMLHATVTSGGLIDPEHTFEVERG
jgi:ABC-type polysaccharide/polyol phosphate transport system ATPase subunit